MDPVTQLQSLGARSGLRHLPQLYLGHKVSLNHVPFLAAQTRLLLCDLAPENQANGNRLRLQREFAARLALFQVLFVRELLLRRKAT